MVTVRYPKFGDWDRYVYRVGNLFKRLALSIQDLEVPDDFAGKLTQQMFPSWATLVAYLFLHKSVSREIESIFFTYLEPEFPGLKPEPMTLVQRWLWRYTWYQKRHAKQLQREWFIRNAPIDAMARLFVCLIIPDAMQKKNMAIALETIFRHWVAPGSTPSSQKSLAGAKNTLTVAPTFAYN